MGHRTRIVMVFFMIIINSLTSSGQNISLYNLTTNEGLSHIKVNDVYTDEHGMICRPEYEPCKPCRSC